MTRGNTLESLRRSIERIEGVKIDGRRERESERDRAFQPALSFGLQALDAQFAYGGLMYGTHQIVGPAAWAFTALLLSRRRLESQTAPMLIVQERAAVAENGGLYGPGLHALGLDPTHIGLVVARDGAETLRIVDEALKSAAVSAVIGEFRRGQRLIDLSVTQRFNMSAQRAQSIGFLVTPEMTQTSAALTQWRVVSAPSLGAEAWLGPPALWLELVRNRSRGGSLGGVTRWRVEWSYEDHAFRLSAPIPASVVRTHVHRPGAPGPFRDPHPDFFRRGDGHDRQGERRIASAGRG